MAAWARHNSPESVVATYGLIDHQRAPVREISDTDNGYLNRAELSAKCFVSNALIVHPQERLYKSGDLGENCAHCRIDIGEIEAQLLQQLQMVLAREDELGEQRSVSYVMGDRRSPLKVATDGTLLKLRSAIAGDWETLFEQTYDIKNQTDGPSFVSWNSSYADRTTPEAEVQEWLANTVTGIGTLRPNRVVEIGCGVGLLLWSSNSSRSCASTCRGRCRSTQRRLCWMVLTHLPLTPNGKVDHRKLPAPEFGAYVEPTARAPAG